MVQNLVARLAVTSVLRQAFYGFTGALFWTTALALPLTACATISTAQANKKDPVSAHFNHTPTSRYQDPYRQIERAGEDLEAILLSAINSAQKSIDLAVQEIQLPLVAQALARKHLAGVQVRIVLENEYSQPLSTLTADQVAKLDDHQRSRYESFKKFVDTDGDGTLSPSETAARDSLIILKSAGVAIIDDTFDGSKGSGLMHHKFLVIDGSTTVVTSANFTLSDIHGDWGVPQSLGNPNALLRFDSVEVSRIFGREFSELWSRKFGLKKSLRGRQGVSLPGNDGSTPVTIQFSPTSKTKPWDQSVNGLIAETAARARVSADLALFVFSEQQIADALQTAQTQGARVRALIEPDFAYRNYSELLDLLGLSLRDEKCRHEKGNFPWTQPITDAGTARLPDGDRLHHKFAVLDDSRVLFGSHNWSAAANNTNDETFMIIEDSAIARAFAAEFDRLIQNARLGAPAWLIEKIGERDRECLTP